ncbi:MAG TPA: SIR2 family protein [Candidatus Omnitrophota bacterium]|mgnify:CR=1 FL=1|nr:SIR2 family protein [Candidatus Omnitrophota bacterium]
MFYKTTTSINPEFQYFTKNRDTIFFLGAGFSADLGLPIMKDFRSASELERNLLSQEDTSIKPAVRIFLDSYRFYDDFREIVEKAKKHIKVDPDNFEDIFCVAESFLHSGMFAQKLDGGKYHMQDVYMHIGFWLWNMYKQFPPLDIRKGKTEEGRVYEDFFAFLKDKTRDRMSIVTTNYDLTCEYYMNKNRFQISYPIPKAKYKDVSICRCQNYYVNDRTSFDSVPLCKLHGSINYFENNKRFFINRELSEAGACVGGSSIPSERPALFALDALSEIRSKLKNPLGQLRNFEIGVVPPTYAKLDKREWLKYIWNGAFDLIRRAKKIVFIGYSFPVSDGFMKSMFQAAFSLRGGDDDLRIIVVDKNKSVLEKFKSDDYFGNRVEEVFEGQFVDVWRKGELRARLQSF